MNADPAGPLSRALAPLGGEPRQRDEAATLAAAVLACADPENTDAAASLWAAGTGLPQSGFATRAIAGNSWQSQPTPVLAELAAADPQSASRYARQLAEVAAATAGVQPLDLRRLNAAAFTAAAQLRAVSARLPGPPAASGGRAGSIAAVIANIATGDAAGTGAMRSDPGSAAAAPKATGTGAAENQSGQPQPPQTLEQLYAELDALIGLSAVKSEVRQQAELLRIERLRQQRGMKTPDVSRHLVFTGNPGTGKTTVARLVARIYRVLGLLASGHLVEVDRSGLVGGYLGQTESKTAEVIQRALGGVLFVDEAYALTGDQYGEAAVSTLVKAIEDHREDLVVIFAGYTEPMAEFIEMNPGLASRMRLTLFFPDYSDDELVRILGSLAAAADYTPTAGFVAALRDLLARTWRGESFGNARFVRNCFEAALVRQAWRLREVAEPSDQQLRELTEADLGEPPDLIPPVPT